MHHLYIDSFSSQRSPKKLHHNQFRSSKQFCVSLLPPCLVLLQFVVPIVKKVSFQETASYLIFRQKEKQVSKPGMVMIGLVFG